MDPRLQRLQQLCIQYNKIPVANHNVYHGWHATKDKKPHLTPDGWPLLSLPMLHPTTSSRRWARVLSRGSNQIEVGAVQHYFMRKMLHTSGFSHKVHNCLLPFPPSLKS